MRSRYFPLFDSLRGLAALAVLTFHVTLLTPRLGNGPFGRVAEVFGSVGVLLFFAISGFLLYRPFVAARAAGHPQPGLREYARRRALRILPAYWLILTVQAVYPGVHGPFSADFWRYYGFLQLYDKHTVTLGMPVAWSLCVEVTFYAALPLWAWTLRRVRLGDGEQAWLRMELAALGAIALLGGCLQLAAVHTTALGTLSRTLIGQAPWFALGMGLAVLSVVGKVRFSARAGGLCWAGAGLALAGLAALVPAGGIFGLIRQEAILGVPGTAERLALSFVFVGLLVAPAVFGDGVAGVPQRVLSLRPVAWAGMVSYSVYLWHLPVAELLARDGVPAQFSAGGLGLVHRIHVLTVPVLWVLTAAITFALSALTFRYVELPFIRRAGSRSRALRDAKEW